MEAPRSVLLPDGRSLVLDDVGDPDGDPVLYLHGTPDCRLARHPDDTVAWRLGVRLLAVDRPGVGRSDRHPALTLTAFADDLRSVLDDLGLERVGVLGWSSGGLFALATAAALGERVAALSLVGPVPPVEAYADGRLVAALGPSRRPFAELATELRPDELATELAPYLVPDPVTPATARDHVWESAGERGRAELAAVPGAAERMTDSLLECVAGGREGLVDDLAAQLEPGVDLAPVTSPVRTWHGVDDPVSPPAVGHWLAARVPHAVVETVPDAGHHLLFPRWAELLTSLLADATTGNGTAAASR